MRFLRLLIVVSFFAPIGVCAKTVRLSWKPLPNAVSYEVELDGRERSALLLGVKQRTEWHGDIKPGSYKYRIRAVDRRGRPGAWTDYKKLIVLSSDPELGLPKDNFTLPVHDASKPAVLQWKPLQSPDRVSYHVRIVAGGKTLIDQTSETPELKLPALPNGSYRWKIEPIVEDSSGEAVQLKAEERDFKLIRQELDAPALVSPAASGKLKKSGLTLAWPEVKGAVSYRVTVIADGAPAGTPSRTLIIKDHYFSRENLPKGRYRIQVSALTAEDLSNLKTALASSTGAGTETVIEVTTTRPVARSPALDGFNLKMDSAETESMSLCPWTKSGTVLSLFLCSASFAAPLEQVASPAPAETQQACPTAQEYVKTLAYLRSERDFAIAEPKARVTAEQVSKGCEGASARFSTITHHLSDAGLVSYDAIALGADFALRTSEQAEAFVKIFDATFGSDALNLDLRNSVKIALALTAGYKGSARSALRDFEALTSFCVSEEQLDLPKPTCAMFAARVTEEGHEWKEGVANAYIQLVHFIRSQQGPAYPTDRALQFAETLVATGPGADQNFIRGYQFGIEKTGLALASADAVGFAMKLVRGSDRTPASPNGSPR